MSLKIVSIILAIASLSWGQRAPFEADDSRLLIRHWVPNAGGNLGDSSRWEDGIVPLAGESAYVYKEGPFSILSGLTFPTWNSFRVDGSAGAVVVNHGAGKITANEFAVGIYGETPGQGGVYRLSGGTREFPNQAGSRWAGLSWLCGDEHER